MGHQYYNYVFNTMIDYYEKILSYPNLICNPQYINEVPMTYKEIIIIKEEVKHSEDNIVESDLITPVIFL